MKDHLYLGPVPYAENCSQLGSENFVYKSTIECEAYINQLKRMFPSPQKDNYFKIKWNNHDFGMYPEVIVYYDNEDSDSADFALNAERNGPEFWDEEAKKEIGIID